MSPPATSFPTKGTARILGETLGSVDVFELRPRIGMAGIALADKLPRSQTVLQTVLTAAYGMTATWREDYETVDEQRARAFLDVLGMTEHLDRKFGTLSEGERKAHPHRPRDDDRPRAADAGRARRGPRPRRPRGPGAPPRPARPGPRSPPRW
ncbi:hypothetical protein GCM10020221_17260 [Streptomyces thioluteus]|uniref:Uncharacterized protein n=1 Tax=Streptomyces thioluteus TaxID=66431 RepID=A0ABP6J559_STRTU